MCKIRKCMTVFFAVLLCLFLSGLLPTMQAEGSAAQSTAATEQEAKVNGGLVAEILPQTIQDGVVPITIQISNSNIYDVSGISYKLTASDNGLLSGQTQIGDIGIASEEMVSYSAQLSLNTAGTDDEGGDSQNPSTGGDKTALLSLVVVGGAVAFAILFFTTKKKRAMRRFLSMFLCLCFAFGLVTQSGVNIASAIDGDGMSNTETAEESVFIVTKDVIIGGETIKVSLEVTYPDMNTTHTVSFLNDEGDVEQAFAVPHGDHVDAAAVPLLSRAGRAFVGWYEDEEATEYYFTDTPVTSDVTLYPGFEDANDVTYYDLEFHQVGIVKPDHKIVLLSPTAITSENWTNFAELECLFGDVPDISVTDLGDGRYSFSGVFSENGHYRLNLIDDTVSFEGLVEAIRIYDFNIEGESVEDIVFQSDLRPLAYNEFVSMEETDDAMVIYVDVYGSDYLVGDKIGVRGDNGKLIYYRVTRIVSSFDDTERGRTKWRLEVTPCTFNEIYESVNVHQPAQAVSADDITTMIDNVDLEEMRQNVENSEGMRVFADYIGSMVNDSSSFRAELGKMGLSGAYIPYISDTMINASSTSSSGNTTEDTVDAVLSALQNGISYVKTPGVSVDVGVDNVSLKLKQDNKFFSDYASKYFGNDTAFDNGFVELKIAVSISFSINAGNKVLTVTAKATFSQAIMLESYCSGKIDIDINPSKTYKQMSLDAGVKAYSETVLGLEVVMSTSNGKFDISEELNNIASAVRGDYDGNDNPYVERFRNIYSGSKNSFIEVYKQEIFSASFTISILEIKVPIAFVVRVALTAGVGFEYAHRTSFTAGIYKDKGSSNLKTYRDVQRYDDETNLYIVGHAGLKVAINAKLMFSFVGTSWLFSIGLEAEFGFQMNFYGYAAFTGDSNDSLGVYYINMGLYFDLNLKVEALTFIDYTQSLYHWEKTLYDAGQRYVLLGINPPESQTILVPVKESDLKEMIDSNGSSWGKTVFFDLAPYIKNMYTSYFDLVDAKVKNDPLILKELGLKKTYILSHSYSWSYVYDAGGWGSGGVGRAGLETRVTLHPNVIRALLDGEAYQDFIDCIVTVIPSTSLFAFGERAPSTQFTLLFVNERYMDNVTDGTYTANFYVDGELFTSVERPQGTCPWYGFINVPTYYLVQKGLNSAIFNIPTEPRYEDIDIHAECEYADRYVYFRMNLLGNNGVSEATGSLMMQPGSRVADLRPENVAGSQFSRTFLENAGTFLGWKLVGDDSDELNALVPKATVPATYVAVYADDEDTVKVVDQETGAVLKEEKVKRGELYTIDEEYVPEGNIRYKYGYTVKSGELYIKKYSTYDFSSYSSLSFYTFSDVVIEWGCAPVQHQVTFFVNGEEYATQSVADRGYIIDPLGGQANWSQLDYINEDGETFRFMGWKEWHNDKLVDWSTIPITGTAHIYAYYDNLGKLHDITLLDEKGAIVYSGQAVEGTPLEDILSYYMPPSTEYTYVFNWKSTTDGSIGTVVNKSDTYQVSYTPTARTYTFVIDNEDLTLPEGVSWPTLTDTVAYNDIKDYLDAKVGSLEPIKSDTEYETYSFTNYYYTCTAGNWSDEHGTCTVKFYFATNDKACTVEYDANSTVLEMSGTVTKDGTAENTVNGVYTFDAAVSVSAHSLTIEHLAVPTDRNYYCTGWMYNNKTYKLGDEIDLTGLESITLTAVYELKPLMVTFDTDGGNDLTNYVIYALSGEKIQLPSATKAPNEMYTFSLSGWKDEDDVVHYDGTYTLPENNVTLTAVYTRTIRSYNIVFDANGGSFSDGTTQKTVSVEYGGIPDFTLEPTRADTIDKRFTFAGWDVDIVSVSSEATYTAVWTEKTLYAITFDANNGSFDANSTSLLTYYVEDGESFDTSIVPEPFFLLNNVLRAFTGWSPALTTTTITPTANTTYTATWSEDGVEELGILITGNGVTEDVATYLAGTNKVTGYRLIFISATENAPSYYSLEITGSELTLSGEGAIGAIDIVNTSTTTALTLTLDSLKLNMTYDDIFISGICDVTVKGQTTIANSESVSAGDLIRLENYNPFTEKAAETTLSLIGYDANASLTLTSIRNALMSYGKEIIIKDLNMQLTAKEFTVVSYNETSESVAIGTDDGQNITTVENSTITITNGIIAGSLNMKDSTIKFTSDGEYTGKIIIYASADEFTDNPVKEPLMVLDNSQIIFKGKVFTDITFAYYTVSVDLVTFCFTKLDVDGKPTYFDSNEELAQALANPEINWLVELINDAEIKSEISS